MAEKKKVGFLGTGKMGGILVEGIVSAGLCAPEDIIVFDVSSEATGALAKRHGVSVAVSAGSMAAASDMIFVCVKPLQFLKSVEGLKGRLEKGRIVVSIMAGVNTSAIREALGAGIRVLRVMPNVACLVGHGASALSKKTDAPDDVKEFVFKLFDSLGCAVWVEEAQMDAVTALSGSGPAYFFMMIEALIDAGVRVGLDRATSTRLSLMTALGSADMASKSQFNMADLRAQVSSPGGTTVAGTAVLEKRAFRSAVIEAVIAACERSRELGG